MRVVAMVLVVFAENELGFKTNWGMVWSESPLLGTFVVGSSTVKWQSGWMDRSFISFADGIIIIIIITIIITIIIIHY